MSQSRVVRSHTGEDAHGIALEFLLSLLAPPLCACCGAEADRIEPLCADCRLRLDWLGLDARVGAEGIEAWAPLAYAGPARALVAALKYDGSRRAAAAMSAQMAAALPSSLAAGTALVPVPLHPARERRRGFNQALLLARGVGRHSGLGVLDCLTRAGESVSQVGRDRAARQRAVSAFSADLGAHAPQSVVIVDDVITTGATVRGCAAALAAAGARHIGAIAYAATRAH